MIESSRFITAAVEKIEKEFAIIILDLDDHTTLILESITQLISQKLSISYTAVMGLTYRSVKRWEKEQGKSILQLTNMPIDRRLVHIKLLFEDAKDIFKQVLLHYEDQREIDKVLDEAYQLYLTF